MRVTVNGRDREVAAGLTVAALLGDAGVDAERTVVELNRQVLTHEAYGSTTLRPGDTLELVEVVGGG